MTDKLLFFRKGDSFAFCHVIVSDPCILTASLQPVSYRAVPCVPVPSTQAVFPRKYKMILMLTPSSLPVYHFSKLMQRENVKWLFSCQCFFQHKARSRIFPEKKRQKLSSSIAKTIFFLYLLLLSYMSQVMLRMSYLVILLILYILKLLILI